MGTSKAKKPNTKKGAGRLARTLRSLIYIVSLGVILAVYNAVSLRRDVALATGPVGPAQREFLKGAADRPDIASFFKHLTPEGRLKMSKNIGQYDDVELANLCGKLLDTFDPEARVLLTASLTHVALVHPEAVAEQFKLPGSFQQVAVTTALRKAGAVALPLVDKQLAVGDARPNAVSYLVGSGPAAIAPTLPYLDVKDKDTRLAAVDAIGKLRATQAVPKLIQMYQGSKEEERLAYFTALATIGAPSTQDLMTTVLTDEAMSTPLRAQAALGLGQIGLPSALTTVWTFTASIDQTLHDSAITALQLAGDKALRIGVDLARSGPRIVNNNVTEPAQRAPEVEVRQSTVLQVAGGIHSIFADSFIEAGLQDPLTSVQAALVSGSRPELVSILTAHAKGANPDTQGDKIDALFRALATTVPGRTALKEIGAKADESPIGALAARRLKLSGG